MCSSTNSCGFGNFPNRKLFWQGNAQDWQTLKPNEHCQAPTQLIPLPRELALLDMRCEAAVAVTIVVSPTGNAVKDAGAAFHNQN